MYDALQRSLALSAAFGLALAAGCSPRLLDKKNSKKPAAPAPTAAAPAQAAQSASTERPAVKLDYFGDFAKSTGGQPNGIDVSVAAMTTIDDQALVLEDHGRMQVIDLEQGKLARSVELIDPLIGARPDFMGELELAGKLALATRTGKDDHVYAFDARDAKGPGDVYALAVGQDTDYQGSLKRSDGKDVSSPMKPSFTSAVAVHGSRLIVGSSNFVLADKAYDPGTLQVYRINPATGEMVAKRDAVIPTGGYNITGLTVFKTDAGSPILLVTHTHSAKGVDARIDVLDLSRMAIVGSIGLGQTHPLGDVVVTPDGKRGFVGSQDQGEIYELDLANLDAELANEKPADLDKRALRGGKNPIAVPSPSTKMHMISSLVLDPSGRYLAAADFNDSSCTIIDIKDAAKEVVAQQFTDFRRSGDPAKFENNLAALAFRAKGTPDLLGLTINLAKADQKTPDVKLALDAISTGTR